MQSLRASAAMLNRRGGRFDARLTARSTPIRARDRSTLLRAVLGLAGGHILACAVLHDSGAAPAQLIGWASRPTTLMAAVLIAWLVVSAHSRLHCRTAWRVGRPGSLVPQLLVHASLLGTVEVLERAADAAPLVGPTQGMLADPVVWLGLIAQVAAALWIHACTRTLQRVPAVAGTSAVPPALRAALVTEERQSPRRDPLDAGWLLRRGPPAGVPLLTRS